MKINLIFFLASSQEPEASNTRVLASIPTFTMAMKSSK